MDYTIVVSNNNKNIDWTNVLSNVMIYNHENEFVSYLNYIIEHYDNLPSYIVLLKDNPFEDNKYITRDNIIEQIDGLLLKLNGEQTCDAIPFFNKPTIEPQYVYPGIRVPEYYYKFFDGDIPREFEYNEQNQYILSRIGIKNRPITFYVKLRDMLINSKITTFNEIRYLHGIYSNTSINKWIFQRIFPYVFDLNVKLNINK
jgi:Protein of unknown function (DUF3431)